MPWRSSRGVSFTLLAPAAALVAPAPVFAVDYLTPEQAQAQMFPEAERFEAREVTLDGAQRQALKERLGTAVRERWPVRLARRGEQLLGAVVVDDVIGKFERITYAVGIGSDGAIRQVEVLSYRESHGHEIRLPAWRKQFVGKTAAAPLEVGKDIANISGATLSCHHVTDGVRRIVEVMDQVARAGALR
jgi:Na+-translocating ferredoxin:NAD+ oxidoreductase RnfG subunit